MKKIIVIMFAAIMVLECSFSSFASTIPNNKGTVETVFGDEEMQSNYGTVGQNYGWIGNNYGEVTYQTTQGILINNDGGLLEANDGRIENNHCSRGDGTGVIKINTGTIKENYSGGVVIDNGYESNDGIVETNGIGGIIENNLNYSIVTYNNGGEVKNNKGEVTNNAGEVDNNSGTVTNNRGKVDNNQSTGKVKENSRTVVDNAGTVENNNASGTVEYNSGTVENNNGRIETNIGIVEKNGLTGVVDNAVDKELSASAGTVQTNYGEVDHSVIDETGNYLIYDADNGKVWFGVTYGDGSFSEGGSAIENVSVNSGDTIIVKFADDIDKRTGYSFGGWKVETTEEGIYLKTYQGGESVTVKAPIWFTAVWNKIIEEKNNATKTVYSQYSTTDTGTGSATLPATVEWRKDSEGNWSCGNKGVPLFTETWGNIANTDKNSSDWYYFDENGKMLTGLQTIDNKTYYLRETKDSREGAMEVGLQFVDGTWRCFGESGAMINNANASTAVKEQYTDKLNSEMMEAYNTPVSNNNSIMLDVYSAVQEISEGNTAQTECTLNIPYPDGSWNGKDYMAVQLNEDDEMERIDAILTNKGIQIKAESFEPIGIAWNDK